MTVLQIFVVSSLLCVSWEVKLLRTWSPSFSPLFVAVILCHLSYTSTWPHMRCDVGLEEGEYRKKLSLCYSIVYYYNGAQRYEQFLQVSRMYRALILLGLSLYLPCSSLSSMFMVLYVYIDICLLTSVSWAWWDWLLTWLTDYCLSLLLHCWLSNLIDKIIPEMT